jgi:hypothetical protein
MRYSFVVVLLLAGCATTRDTQQAMVLDACFEAGEQGAWSLLPAPPTIEPIATNVAPTDFHTRLSDPGNRSFWLGNHDGRYALCSVRRAVRWPPYCFTTTYTFARAEDGWIPQVSQQRSCVSYE